MIEKAVRFGPDRALLGVWTEPEGSDAEYRRPGVVLLNGGIVHHTGTYRLHVRAARALAAKGFASLRFDFRGIGDSEDPREGLPLNDLIVQDMDAAVSYVAEAHGRERIVMLGYCSGAFDALQAAGRRQEVVGIVSLDLNADFLTWRHHIVYLSSRLLRWESWWNTVTARNDRVHRLARRLFGREEEPVQRPESTSIAARRPLSREEVRAWLGATLARDVELLCVFSGGVPALYSHERQFADALPDVASHPRSAVRYLPEADHAFSARDQQEVLLGEVVEWMQARFGNR